MKIMILLASTRQHRMGEVVANWVYDAISRKKLVNLDAELVDLKDFELPNFNESNHPLALGGNYSDPVANKWVAKVAEADGFLVVTPEYNHGYPAALKNALDYPYAEWNNKPVAFVSYGGIAGGSRSVEQLRQVAIELLMHPTREAVVISNVQEAFDRLGKPLNPHLGSSLDKTWEQLVWWTKVLHEVRQKEVARVGV